MAAIDLKNVSKSYGEGIHATRVLQNIDLAVEAGEFLVLLGFSGTGKTTLINLMAGREFPTTGTVTCKGKPITGPGPERGVIFQSCSLMPWLTVHGNVRLALDAVFPKMKKRARSTSRCRRSTHSPAPTSATRSSRSGRPTRRSAC